MPIEKLFIKSFRNIEETQWELAPGLNVLEGENAQGKSNFLEAIYFLANGRSFRTLETASLPTWGAEGSWLRGQLRHGELRSDLEVRISSEGRQLRLQEKPQKSWSKVFEIFRVLIFTPDSTGLFRQSPGQRRRYFDQAMGVHRPVYGGLIQRYARVLRQRNQWLEDGAPEELREAFDRQWAALTLQIMLQRQSYLRDLLPRWEARLASLTQSHAPLSARWEGRLNLEEASDEEALLKALAQTRTEESRWRCTVLGPNREDLKVYFGRHPVREVGSQGQQRMLVIALKLAEADLFTERSGTAPVFLLDDIGSELDPGHLGKLLNMLGEIRAQTVLTSAHIGAFHALGAKTLEVQKGKLLSISTG